MGYDTPMPDRSNCVPGSDREVKDIGWCEGYLLDGRPYLGECWAMDGLTQVTLFFSSNATPNLEDHDTAVRFLREHALVIFKPGREYVTCRRMLDASGAPVWSVNITVGQEDCTFVLVEDMGVVHPYPRPGPPRRRPDLHPRMFASRPGRWRVHAIFTAGFVPVLALVMWLTAPGRTQELAGLASAFAWTVFCYGFIDDLVSPEVFPLRNDLRPRHTQAGRAERSHRLRRMIERGARRVGDRAVN